MMREIENERDFKEYVELSDKLTLVYFMVEWSGPCKTLTPKLHILSPKYDGRVGFYQIDGGSDESADLVSRFSITSYPTIILFKGTEVVAKQIKPFVSEEWINFYL